MKRWIIISLIVCFPVWMLYAQESLTLHYKEAVKIALDNNVRLKQEENTLTSLNARKTAAYGSLGPNVTARGTALRSEGNYFIEQEARVVNTVSQNFYGTLDANITIFNGFNRMNTIKRSNSMVEAQLSGIERTEQEVINLVTRQYLQVLQDQEQVRIARENYDNQSLLFEQIETMFEAGSIAITDKYNQEYQVRNAELLLLRARINLKNDMATLAQVMMIDPAVEIILEDPAWDVNDVLVEDYDLDQLYSTAMEHRGDLEQVRANEEATEKFMSVTKSNFYPSLVGFFSLSSRYTDVTPRTFNEQFTVDNRRTQLGVQLSVPIFSGLRNKAQFVEARVQHENAKLEIQNQEVIVKSEVLRTYQNFLDVAEAYEVSKLQYQAAEKAFETQTESYELGLSSQIELAQANRDFIDAQTALSQAKYALLFQKILVEYATGTLEFDNLP